MITQPERVAFYATLTPKEKLDLAQQFYRAFGIERSVTRTPPVGMDPIRGNGSISGRRLFSKPTHHLPV